MSGTTTTEDWRKQEIRAQASKIFCNLEKQASSRDANTAESWVRRRRGGGGLISSPNDDDKKKNTAEEEEDQQRSANCRFFDYTGFTHIRNFADPDECAAMKQQMASLVETQWDISSKPSDGDAAAVQLDSFGTSDQHNTKRGDYFLESSDKVHFFAEPDALLEKNNDDEENNNEGSSHVVRLKECYRNNKIAALNKSGHAMHMQDGAFRDYCLSDKVRNLVTELGWEDPVVPQSMYIFKQALHGGVVNSHQDSTFLFTTPRQTCLGLWLALDDANLDNGCLWVRPKSHEENVRRQFRRNPAHFGDEAVRSRSNQPAGDTTQPKFIMENLCEHDIVWEGRLPGDDDDDDDNVCKEKNEKSDAGGGSGSKSTCSSRFRSLLDAGFVPVECKAGDLLAFCGQLDHLSLPNTSTRSRHTFQLHLVEGPGAGVSWSESNWLQYPDGKPFLRLLGES